MPRVIFLGDSITAGYGLDLEAAYPAVLEAKMKGAGINAQVVNGGVSGDTTSNGLSRLTWVLKGGVDVLVLALGSNDALRGLPPPEIERNLRAIITRTRERNPAVRILLVGALAPPNYGSEYESAFRKIYADITRTEHVTLLPFLLEGVAGRPELNQNDGIHPTAEGQRIVADHVWTALQPLLANSGNGER